MDALDGVGCEEEITVNGVLELGLEHGAVLVVVSNEDVATVVGYK